MKDRTIIAIFAVVIISLSAAAVFSDSDDVAAEATTFTQGGFNYEVIDATELTVKVTGASATGDIIIPSAATDPADNVEYNVIAIGEWAFSSRLDMTSVTIPDTVTSIEAAAFNDCRNLVSVNIPSGIESISPATFRGCESLGSISIPSSVKSIGHGAFDGCAGLKSITIPDNVTFVDDYAFNNCDGLESIEMPINIPITRQMFDGVTSVTSVTLTAGTGTTKGVGVNYTSMGTPITYTYTPWYKSRTVEDGTTVTISDGVTSIGDNTFMYCKNIKTVSLPDSIRSIDNSVFSYCENLESVNLPYGIESIGESAFLLCKSLTSIAIPSTVISLGVNSFSNCENLKSANIPDGIESILLGTFNGCWSLESITIPVGVKSIGNHAFNGCWSLESIIIPSSVESIGFHVFNDCRGVKSFNVDPENTKYHSKDGILFDKAMETLMYYPLAAPGSSYAIPSSVKSIGSFAFYGSANLDSITIPDSVTSIGGLAFFNCIKLVTVTIIESGEDVVSVLLTQADPWKLIGPTTELEKIVISGSLKLPDSIAGAEGKLIQFTEGSIGTTGGEFYDEKGELIVNAERAGKTFMYDTDLTKWVILQYVVSLETDPIDGGTTSGSGTFPEMSSQTITATADEGYRFIGWADDGEGNELAERTIIVDGDITYTALFIKVHTVKFDSNGGSPVADGKVDDNTTVTKPTDPGKEGYNFGGWYDEDLETEYVFTSSVVGDLTLYAKWIPKEYTIKFNSKGGSDVADMTAGYETTIIWPDDPIKTGYEFAGWYLDEGLNNAVDYLLMPLGGDTLYAKWTPNKYTISFDSRGGSDVQSITFDYMTMIDWPDDPTKVGHKFKGWYLDEGLNNAVDYLLMPLGGDTLYAKWTINQYKITFVENNGSDVDDIVQDYDGDISWPDDPERTGYEFAGWYDNPGLNGDPKTYATMPAGNVTLYAKWNAKPFDITFDTVGGDPEDPIPVTYGDEYELPLPTKTGMYFDGWMYADTPIPLTGTWSIDSDETELTLTATWSDIPSFEVTFSAGAGTTGTAPTMVNQFEDAELTIPDEGTLKKKGHGFIGWKYGTETYSAGDMFTMPGEAVEFVAVWKIAKYELTFTGEGIGEIGSITRDYNSSVDLPSPSARTGYTFDGWRYDGTLYKTDIPYVIPANDVIFVAEWTAIPKYTVTFDMDGHGTQVESKEVYKGDTVELPTPSEIGYEFEGWSLSGNVFTSSMPVMGNITLVATWALGEYTITFESNGGTTHSPITAYYTENIILPSPIRTGYDFVGWYDNEDLNGDAVTITAMPYDIEMLYAKWSIKQYTILFESDGSEFYKETADFNAPITWPADPIKDGYRFGGWYTSLSFAIEAEIYEVMPINGAKAYAKWIKLISLDHSTDSVSFIPEYEGYVELLLKTEHATIHIPSDVFDEMIKGQEAELAMRKVTDTSGLDYYQLNAVRDAVLLISSELIVGGSSVDAGFNGEMTITLNYALREGESADDLSVALMTYSDLTEIDDAVYDEDEGTITFKTSFIPQYIVLSSTSQSEGGNGDGGGNTMIYIGAGVVVAVVIAVIALLVMRRP